MNRGCSVLQRHWLTQYALVSLRSQRHANRGTRRWTSCAFAGGNAWTRLRFFATVPNSETHWPDGTPKKFFGKDAWKNWIDWDSPFKDSTDELNRQRQYFWEVDAKGELWRLELDRPGERFGRMSHLRVLDIFFANLNLNLTGLYTDVFPFLSLRGVEHNFVRWSRADEDGGGAALARTGVQAPVVFNDMTEGKLRYIVRGSGEAVPSITTTLDPASLRLTADGLLLHPFQIAGTHNLVDGPCGGLLATIDSATTQAVLEAYEVSSCDTAKSGLVLRSGDVVLPLRLLDE